MRSSGSRRLLLLVAAALATLCVLSVAAIGGVSAEEVQAEVDVAMDDPVFEGDGQTVEVEVENPDDTDLIFPLVEIPLGDALEIPEERQDEADGTTFVDGVTVDVNGEEEDRTAFIDDSTFRNGDALFIEGEELEGEGDETKTYAVDLTVTSTNELTVEADVRPLNAEENNVREATTVDPVASGTLDVSTDGDDEIEISSDQVDLDLDLESIADGEEAVDVPGGFDYDVSTELSVVGQSVTVTDLTVEEFNTETVEFFDAEPGEAVSPIVIAQTNDAAVIDNSASRSTDRGDAATRTTQTVEFDAESAGGSTILALEDESDLPMQGIDGHDSDESEWIDHDERERGVAQLENDGEFDRTLSVTLEGYLVGDVTLTNEVTADDAETIGSAVASGDDISQYGDVNDDGEITAVDAMKIQQVVEENRTDDYESLTGNGGGGE